MRNRRAIAVAATLAFGLIAGPGAATAQDLDMPFVAVTTITNDAETQAIIDGMRDQLARRGRWPGDTVRIVVTENGTDQARATERARAFVRDGADVLVAITAPAIEAALAASARTPLVIAGVSLEAADGFKRDRRRRNVTGIVSGQTHSEQFALIKRIAPQTRTVAVPVDPVDGSMQARLQDLTALARRHDLAIVPLPVSVLQNAVSNRIAELDPATSAILLDRTLLPDAPVEALAAATEGRRLPLYATDEDSVVRGALAAMVVDPFGIGIQLGDLIARILEEPAATRAPFERARATHLVVNQDARSLIDVAALERDPATVRQSVVDWADIAGPRPRIKPSAPEPPPPLGIRRGIDVPTPRAKPDEPSR